MKKKLPPPARTGKVWWLALSKEKKCDTLEIYFEAGWSDVEIEYRLDIPKTSVKRFRNPHDRRTHPEWFNRYGKRKKVPKKKPRPTPKPKKVVNIKDRKPYKRPPVKGALKAKRDRTYDREVRQNILDFLVP